MQTQNVFTQSPHVTFSVTAINSQKITTVVFTEDSTLLPQGKAIPLQAWTGPEGSSRLRLPDFKTFGT